MPRGTARIKKGKQSMENGWLASTCIYWAAEFLETASYVMWVQQTAHFLALRNAFRVLNGVRSPWRDDIIEWGLFIHRAISVPCAPKEGWRLRAEDGSGENWDEMGEGGQPTEVFQRLLFSGPRLQFVLVNHYPWDMGLLKQLHLMNYCHRALEKLQSNCQ